MPPTTPTVETLEYELGDASGIGVAIENAQPHAQILAGPDAPGAFLVARRNDRTIEQIDVERFMPQPVRPRGTVRVFTADGFTEAYVRRADAKHELATIYADPDACRLVAVINDDNWDKGAGWRDHRIVLDLKTTDEWDLWFKGQGYQSQEEFAEILEAGEREIVDPSPTAMLDMAQTFHATMGAQVKRSNRLRDGRTQLVYEESIDATAGAAGELTIPEKFVIRVRPFYGATPVDVECRLRYRIERGGGFKIGYSMERPDEVKRLAFATDVLDQVQATLDGVTLIEGVPADPTPAGRR